MGFSAQICSLKPKKARYVTTVFLPHLLYKRLLTNSVESLSEILYIGNRITMKVILAEFNWANNGAGFYVKGCKKKLIKFKSN